jgi:hypothetical protein
MSGVARAGDPEDHRSGALRGRDGELKRRNCAERGHADIELDAGG